MSRTDIPILDEVGDELSLAAARRHAERNSRHPGSVRRRLVVVAAAAAVAVAVVAFVSVGGEHAPNLVERAYAAVDVRDGEVVHVVSSISTPNAPARREELWITPDGCRAHVRDERPDGTLTTEMTEDPATRRVYRAAENELLVIPRAESDPWQISDPLERFRELYRRGDVREAGRTRVGDTDVVRFEMRDGDAVVQYFADARTLQPAEMRLTIDDQLAYTARFSTYETLSGAAADRALAMSAHESATVREHQQPPNVSSSGSLRAGCS